MIIATPQGLVVEKFNPYHDELGRFTSGPGAAVGGARAGVWTAKPTRAEIRAGVEAKLVKNINGDHLKGIKKKMTVDTIAEAPKSVRDRIRYIEKHTDPAGTTAGEWYRDSKTLAIGMGNKATIRHEVGHAAHDWAYVHQSRLAQTYSRAWRESITGVDLRKGVNVVSAYDFSKGRTRVGYAETFAELWRVRATTGKLPRRFNPEVSQAFNAIWEAAHAG